MAVPQREASHEVVISSEAAEDAEHILGVEVRAGDRVRFRVIDGEGVSNEPSGGEPWPPAWIGCITTDESDLGERAREIMRAELYGS
jgi:hypothetical protein